MHRSTVLLTALLVTAAVSPPALLHAESEGKVVHVFTWAEYIPPATIAEFERQTGIRIVYDNFDSLEVLTTKLLTGGSGYDLVMPSEVLVGIYEKAGVLTKLDKSKLSNLGGLNPDIMSFLRRQDPGNEYSVPYSYGTTGIIYNVDKIKARLVDAPVDSLEMIFRSEMLSKFADCGVAIVDAPDEVMALALNYLGLPPYSTKSADLQKAAALLASIKPFVRHFRTSSIVTEMASGDICLALGWSGDALLARANATDAANAVDIGYSIPKEGSLIFFDTLAIPADARNPENAHALMNFLLAADSAARFTNTYFFSNAVSAAAPLVDDALRSDPGIYPSQTTMQTLFAGEARDPKSQRLVTRIWTTFTTGN